MAYTISIDDHIVDRASKLLGRDISADDPFFQYLLNAGLEVEEELDRFYRALDEGEEVASVRPKDTDEIPF